jgi:hypothetical protein
VITGCRGLEWSIVEASQTRLSNLMDGRRQQIGSGNGSRSLYHDNVELTQIDEELTVRTLNCHYCKKRISITTVPEFIDFCDIDCAENWKKGF